MCWSMPLNRGLIDLTEKYPLPKGWALGEVFQETLEIGALRLNLLGLIGQSQELGEAVASAVSPVGSPAGSPNDVPYLRAYFELLERISVLKHEEDTHKDISSDEKPDSCWRYSKSNGIAAHS